ncbi:MAG: ABC transporter substrate-binding protein [Blastocatellia bacterium]
MRSRHASSLHTASQWLGLTLVVLVAGCRTVTPEQDQPLRPADLNRLSLPALAGQVRGSTVSLAMWAGDEPRNRHFRGRVTEEVARRFGISLRIVPLADAADLVNKLLTEKRAGRSTRGSIDLVWINGENFRTARQGDLLWGPFADWLPGSRLYPAVARARDFGTPIEGYEAPWLRAQFVLGHDTARLTDPPRSIPALVEWIRTHPGRFTYPAPPDFTGSVFLRHLLYHFGGGAAAFQESFDEGVFRRAAEPTFQLLRELRPYLWRQGETYPPTLREMDRLFVNQEIDLTMSYSPTFASERIARGEYPPTVRTFVFESGTIGNFSYLAIPFNVGNPAGALVVIDYLQSVEALFEQVEALGIFFPMEVEQLSPEWRTRLASLPKGVATLPEFELSRALLPEANAQYLERLEEEWRKEILLQDLPAGSRR